LSSSIVDVVVTDYVRNLAGTDSPAYSYMTDRRDSTGRYVRFRLRGTYEDEKAALDALPPKLRRKAAGTNTLDFLFGRKA